MVTAGRGNCLWQMRSDQVAAYLKKKRLILIPFGAVEQHGPSLPVGTDAVIAEEIAAAVSEKTGYLYAPVTPFGLSAFHMNFPGTISLSTTTYAALVKDIMKSLRRHGFTRMLLVNAHFENSGILRAVAEEVASEVDDLVAVVSDFWDLPAARAVADARFGEPGGHADAADASIMLHVARDTVASSKFVSEWPTVYGIVSRDLAKSLVTQSGVIGSDQRKASIAAGSEYFEAIVADTAGRARALDASGPKRRATTPKARRRRAS